MAHPIKSDILRDPSFLTLGRLLWKYFLRVESALPARGSASTVDLKDSFGRQARVRRTYFPPFPRTSDIFCCADFLLPDSWTSRWKTSCGSCLRRPHAASASIQDVLLEKGISRSTFTNRPCRPDLASIRAFSYFSNSTGTSVCVWKTSPSCVLLCFMCSAFA